MAEAVLRWQRQNKMDPGPGREQALTEYMSMLPDGHVARREFALLKEEIYNVRQLRRRSERVQVASRVLAAILVNDNYPLGDRLGTSEAVAMADALLTRIDETEADSG